MPATPIELEISETPEIPQETAWRQIVAAFQNPDLNQQPFALNDAVVDIMVESGTFGYWAALTEAVVSCSIKSKRSGNIHIMSEQKVLELHNAARDDEHPIAFLQDFAIYAHGVHQRHTRGNPAIKTPDHFFEWAIDEFAPIEPTSYDCNFVEDVLEPQSPRPKSKQANHDSSVRFYEQQDKTWNAAVDKSVSRVGECAIAYMLYASSQTPLSRLRAQTS